MNTTTIPTSVVGNLPRGLYGAANQLRADIKTIAARAEAVRKSIRVQPAIVDPDPDTGVERVSAIDAEVIANAALAYRHLEDASMRFGKMMQALDGGVSVYDKATTVGAVMDKEG